MSDKTRILLIDDDQVDRAFVRRALTSSGIDFNLVEASNGRDGLAQSENHSFDCVLLDYRLPDVEAVEVLEALLTGERGNTTVVILTGEANPDVAQQLMRLGALDYLSKSEVSPSMLARAIRFARARHAFLTERDEARRLAEEKTHQLQILNDQKDLLFSIIAHDLRNPFQALLGLSELQQRAAARQDIAAMTRYASGIHQAAGKATALMESLFAWGQSQLTATTLDTSRIDVEELVATTLAALAENAATKQLTMHNRCQGLAAQADKEMVATILRNLVINAIKFSEPGGEIAVAGRAAGPMVEVAVSDRGVGIEPEMLANLFRIDKRTTNAGTLGEPGTGLGLIICQNLVARLGGRIHVDSEPGVGTTFRFTLPAPDDAR